MRTIAWLSAVALILAAAFFFAPALVVGRGLATVGTNVPLAAAFGEELTTFWNTGSSELTPGLVDLIDLWRRWHAMKIAISALFTVAMVGLTAAWWARFLAPGATQRQRVGAGTAAGLATVLTLCGTVAIVATSRPRRRRCRRCFRCSPPIRRPGRFGWPWLRSATDWPTPAAVSPGVPRSPW